MIVKNERGFSLIEALISLLVFSIVSAGAYGQLRQILNTEARINQSLRETASLKKELNQAKQNLFLKGESPDCKLKEGNNYYSAFSCTFLAADEEIEINVFKQ